MVVVDIYAESKLGFLLCVGSAVATSEPSWRISEYITLPSNRFSGSETETIVTALLELDQPVIADGLPLYRGTRMRRVRLMGRRHSLVAMDEEVSRWV